MRRPSGRKPEVAFEGPSQEERREKARALMEDQNKKMKEILTADQYAKYEKMPRPGRGGPGGPGAPGEKKEGEKKN